VCFSNLLLRTFNLRVAKIFLWARKKLKAPAGSPKKTEKASGGTPLARDLPVRFSRSVFLCL
jgi:hypothetical protein